MNFPLLHEEGTNNSAYPVVIDVIPWQVVQYIEMSKRADEGDGDSDDEIHTSDSFMYASDYLGDPFDYDDDTYSYYSYHDLSYYSGSWSEDSFCADVFGDMSYHLSFLFDDTSYYSSTSSSTSSPYSSVSFSGGFHKDTVEGHGTWCAGISAGAVSAGSAVPEEDCYGDELPGCAGGCIMASDVDAMLENEYFDIDLFCPMYECDGDANMSYSYCLSDDPVENLSQNNGVAPGAQISVFDAAYTAFELYPEMAGNLLWESAMETGAKIHSNPWGAITFCEPTEIEYLYDSFMYEVRHS